ncbi:MAG: hypothetical protein QG608_2061 [Actinomycetota bacterium]|nr:hypothetical protein [Actinomycetota bacterium]
MTNVTATRNSTLQNKTQGRSRPSARWTPVERTDGTRRLEMSWSVRENKVPSQTTSAR